MIPGEYVLAKGDMELNSGSLVTTIKVANVGDRPVQVGSHFHFFETNRALKFPREEAYGKRLNIIPGTSARFEPGESRTVELVPYGGRRIVAGFNGLVMGSLDLKREAALEALAAWVLEGEKAFEFGGGKKKERAGEKSANAPKGAKKSVKPGGERAGKGSKGGNPRGVSHED
ncbi:MAG: urease subunit beta [Deltaproteobacteria bacterium]|jgi:urease beta subunit|nr:urease subunit beta [Deltaproteobacteria bacterium]